jgi:hypothetical protein
VESRFDHHSEEATLRAKLQQAGEDLLGLWRWVQTLSDAAIARGVKTQLVGRVLAEHFEGVEGASQTPIPTRPLAGVPDCPAGWQLSHVP